MKKFFLITLVVIFVVLLIRNFDVIKKIIETSTGIFRETFQTVTNPEGYK